MKIKNSILLAITGAAVAAVTSVMPADASRAGDDATRFAARQLAIQSGLPYDFYDRQHAMQKSYERGGRRYSNYNSYASPYDNYNPGYGYNNASPYNYFGPNPNSGGFLGGLYSRYY